MTRQGEILDFKDGKLWKSKYMGKLMEDKQYYMCRWYYCNGRKWRETKEPLDEGKRREWKPGFKLNCQKPKIMSSGPITSWQIGWEKGETMTDFVFLGSKITANGDCSCEIKRCLLLARKAMTILDKSRGIILLTEVRIVKAMVFPAVMYGCWTIRNAKCQRIDAFKLWCRRWLLRVLWMDMSLSNAKECSNDHTIALIPHASKVMLKILQARLQQYVNCEIPDVQARFRKGRGTRDQIANIHWSIENAREFQKNIYFCFIDHTKAFDCVDHNKLENS